MRDRAKRAPAVISDQLVRRDGSRLWFRAPQIAPVHDPRAPWPGAAQRLRKRQDREQLDVRHSLESLQAAVDGVQPEQGPAPKSKRDIQTLTEWTDPPRNSPILLLSASELMDSRPGPVLGPGTRYRIVSIAENVVCVQVQALDGQMLMGYVNAVDLLSYEPEIMYLRGKKRSFRLPGLKRGKPAGRMATATG